MPRNSLREILDTFGRMYEHEERQGKCLDQAILSIIKLIPKKKDNFKRPHHTKDLQENAFSLGWNKCIDEIKERLL